MCSSFKYAYFFFISYLNKGEKKRKRKRVSKFWKEQAKLLEDEEAIPGDCLALFCYIGLQDI